MSKTVEIYTMDYCPYCIRAKNLLDKKNVAYTEHRVDRDPACLDEVVKRSGPPDFCRRCSYRRL